MSTSLPALVPISPDVLFQELEDEAVLVDLQSKRYYVLNSVAMRMWQLLAEHGEVAIVAEQLLAEYDDVDEATIHHDLADLIADLTETNLMTVQTRWVPKTCRVPFQEGHT